MQRNGQIRRKGPGGSRPDYREDRFSFQLRVAAAEIVLQVKFYKNRRRGFVVIFNLCFGQRCLAGKTPVDRFFTAKQALILGKLAAFPRDDGFILIIHGQIGVFPVAHNAQAFKLITLNINEFFGILPAKPPDIR